MTLNLNKFIDRHLERANFSDNKKATYSHNELHELCRWSVFVFSSEPTLTWIGAPCVILGSLHGHISDLLGAFRLFSTDDEQGAFTRNYTFLGNYVDYGSHSLETICLLLALKIKYPRRYQLLRGNHECAEVNRNGGFYDELVERFGADEGEKLFEHFNEVFSFMPLAGIVGGLIFCAHGGISPHIRSLKDIEMIPRPLADPLSNPLATDLLWAEPYEKTYHFRPNPERNNSVIFGADNAVKFCEDQQMGVIMRGSDKVLTGGFEYFANWKVISVFSASHFEKDRYNAGSLFSLNENGRLVPMRFARGNLDAVRSLLASDR